MKNGSFALSFLLMACLIQPASLFPEDTSGQDTYNGAPFCRNVRGVHPRPIYQPAAEYDNKARKARIQGSVQLSMIVTQEGRAHDIKVTKSLTPGLDRQAIKAVSQWKFEPAMQDGQPCPMKIDVEMSFHLY